MEKKISIIVIKITDIYEYAIRLPHPFSIGAIIWKFDAHNLKKKVHNLAFRISCDTIELTKVENRISPYSARLPARLWIEYRESRSDYPAPEDRPRYW